MDPILHFSMQMSKKKKNMAEIRMIQIYVLMQQWNETTAFRIPAREIEDETDGVGILIHYNFQFISRLQY